MSAILIVIIIVIILVILLEKKRKVEKFRYITIFDMRRSNVYFDLRRNKESLCVNKMETIFDEEDEGKFIPVGEETKDIIYVSNLSRDMMKIQISTKEDTWKIWNSNKSTNHHLETNEAVELEVFIKPLWITSIEGTIRLFTVTMKKGN